MRHTNRGAHSTVTPRGRPVWAASVCPDLTAGRVGRPGAHCAAPPAVVHGWAVRGTGAGGRTRQRTQRGAGPGPPQADPARPPVTTGTPDRLECALDPRTDIVRGRFGLRWKTRTLVAWAGGRPFVRVDDEITDADRDWASAHHPTRPSSTAYRRPTASPPKASPSSVNGYGLPEAPRGDPQESTIARFREVVQRELLRAGGSGRSRRGVERHAVAASDSIRSTCTSSCASGASST